MAGGKAITELIYQRLEIRQTCCHEKEERRMAKLRMGVVGLGMGKGHAQGYLEHDNVDEVVLCDWSGMNSE